MTQPHRLTRLQDIITQLRSENGCPWDRKQTPGGIRKYLLEETDELAEAIEKGEPEAICDEIGDLFFILTTLCEMYKEKDAFTVDDALQAIIEKMIRRHPHVFNGLPTGTDQELCDQWKAIKDMEKQHSSTKAGGG